jgi:hypothetical protein
MPRLRSGHEGEFLKYFVGPAAEEGGITESRQQPLQGGSQADEFTVPASKVGGVGGRKSDMTELDLALHREPPI